MDSQNNDEVEKVARLLLASSREELLRADTKASFLLATIGIVTSALLAALLGNDWQPDRLVTWGQWAWWIAVIAGLGSIVFVAAAVYPRTTQRNSSSSSHPGYFGDLSGLSVDDVDARLRRLADGDATFTLVHQLVYVSKIVSIKYQYIKLAMWSFGLAVVLLLLAAAAGSQ